MARSHLYEMALRLQQKLTQRLTAYMVDLADGRDIGRYARGERKPHPGTQMKLRDLFSLVSMLTEREDAETIQAWFMGRNPELKHRAPALLLHENFNVNYEQVRKAAIKFSGRYPLTS
ncbi:hypothetical protein WDW37_14130 [Bdellovibrionota bacterium FG-1]